MPEAGQWLRALLEPTQQPPPEALAAAIHKAIVACEAGDAPTARADVGHALQLARELSYL
jgi:hypothetical protein